MDRPWYEFQPKERAAAKKAGMKQYFTGRPCKQGHVAYRCTANGTCNECASIKQKTKLEKNFCKTRIITRKTMQKIQIITDKNLQNTELKILKKLAKVT